MLSPFNFCSNNPINRIDPNGMLDDWFTVNNDGRVTNRIKREGENFDRIFKGTEASEKIYDQSILPQLMEDSGKRNYYHSEGKKINFSFAKTTSKEDVFKVFYFMATNTNAEWSLAGYKDKNKKEYIIATGHDTNTAVATDGGFGYELKNQIVDYHSHPNTAEGPNDTDVVGYWYRKYTELNGKSPAPHFVYNVNYRTLWSYDHFKGSGVKKLRPVNNYKDLYKNLKF